MFKSRNITLFFLFIFLFQSTFSQCKIDNKAFESGEKVEYDLYFKYGIIKPKGGHGVMQTSLVNYNGLQAYKITMRFNTSGLANSIFMVNDTLTSYIDTDLRPLLFNKSAQEGKDYTKEVQSFTYDDNNIDIRAYRVFNGDSKFDETVSTDKCTYDYLSVIPLIRNLDYSNMSKGDKIDIQFLSGKTLVAMHVNYNGLSNIKANNGKTYETINISLTINDPAFRDKKEAIRACLSNDSKRIPITLTTALNVGAIYAVVRKISDDK